MRTFASPAQDRLPRKHSFEHLAVFDHRDSGDQQIPHARARLHRLREYRAIRNCLRYMIGTRLMVLPTGGRLGIYEILSPLGAGGMGEVYRARDTKLRREVALKILPQRFAEDHYRMALFQREARLLALLNHPKIAAIYGLEESGSTRALVMELVEGPTLAERIGRPKPSAGPAPKAAIPLDDALPIAHQLAEALEYAHDRNVVHRDLKPANVKITPDGIVKVLDFGLAKAMDQEDPSSHISNSPTVSVATTQAGFIIGTAEYMSPEQAKGKSVDRRTDIWAFGCVLYEMLTGQKAFAGRTVSDVWAAVFNSEPDWNALPADTPPAIRRLIRRCVAKDPKQRLHDIGDARLAIEETMSGVDIETVGGQVPESRRASLPVRTLPWALGSIAIMLAAIAAWLLLRPTPQQNVFRFSVSPPENADFDVGGLSVSPDGRYQVFRSQAGGDKPHMLWVHPLDSLTSQPIPGTEGASLSSFWSPDSRQIGFAVGGKLEKIALSGGSPVTLCDMSSFSQPGRDHYAASTWSRDGVILFSNVGGVYRVPDSGGTPTLVVAPEATRNQREFFLPQFLPDGRHFLVRVVTKFGPGMIAVGSLDSKTVEDLGPATSNAIYALPGYLFYLDQSTLMARPFDARALRFTGPAAPVAQNVSLYEGPGLGYFSVSPAGVLAYRTEPSASSNQMVWFNRTGQKVGMVGQPDNYGTPSLSPDGDRLAVGRGKFQKTDIWVFDLKRSGASRLTSNSADDTNPIWTTDESQVFFSSRSNGLYGIYQKAANGLGSTQPVFQSQQQPAALNDLSLDGRYAIYDTAATITTNQLWALPLFGDRKPFHVADGSSSAQFSPNGRYVAYNSSETGRAEIYVQTFPQQTGRWEISTSGGLQPMWRRDGKELFYLSPDEKLMAVDVNTTSATFQAGIPKGLFRVPLVPTSYWRNIYVPSPDGQRFLMITPAGAAKPEPITVIVNWSALLKR